MFDVIYFYKGLVDTCVKHVDSLDECIRLGKEYLRNHFGPVYLVWIRRSDHSLPFCTISHHDMWPDRVTLFFTGSYPEYF